MCEMIERMSNILKVMYIVLEGINRKTIYQWFIDSYVLFRQRQK